MKQVNCPVCKGKCGKYGKTKAGSQRWFCNSCKTAFTQKIDNNSKELQIFLDWLFGKKSQSDMSGEGKISYLDYVQIYNKIKELKGGN